jgi:hypothetical protein
MFNWIIVGYIGMMDWNLWDLIGFHGISMECIMGFMGFNGT